MKVDEKTYVLAAQLKYDKSCASSEMNFHGSGYDEPGKEIDARGGS